MTSAQPLGDDARDFWLGERTLTWGTDGHGTNSIRRILDDRAIEEAFEGTGGNGAALLGRRASIGDEADGRWRQTWVDSSGSCLHFGGMEPRLTCVPLD